MLIRWFRCVSPETSAEKYGAMHRASGIMVQDVFRDVTREDLQALLSAGGHDPEKDPAFMVAPLGRSPDDPDPSDAAPPLTLARSRAGQAALLGGDSNRTPGSSIVDPADEVCPSAPPSCTACGVLSAGMSSGLVRMCSFPFKIPLDPEFSTLAVAVTGVALYRLPRTCPGHTLVTVLLVGWHQGTGRRNGRQAVHTSRDSNNVQTFTAQVPQQVLLYHPSHGAIMSCCQRNKSNCGKKLGRRIEERCVCCTFWFRPGPGRVVF